MKCLGITCAVLVVIAIVTGVVVFLKADDFLRWGSARVVETMADGIVEAMGLPPEEQEAIRGPLRDFAGRIESGDITAEQGMAVLQAVAASPLPALVMIRAAERKYIEPSGLDEAQKQQAHKTVTRFMQGVLEGKIPQEALDAAADQVTVETLGADGQTQTQLRAALTDDEVKSLLQTMQTAADAAGVPDREFDIDLAAEVRNAIQQGLQNATGAGGGVDGADVGEIEVETVEPVAP